MNSTETSNNEMETPVVQEYPRIVQLPRYGGQITFPDAQAAIALLKSFYQEDEEEQRETLEYLKQTLDEDRPTYRKLFS